MKIILGFIITGLFLLLGCQYDNASFNYKDYNCTQGQGWDSNYIAQQLIGKWDWKYIVCPEGLYENDTLYNGLVLELIENGTINLIENNIIVKSSSWQVDTIYNRFILATPGIEQTRGVIYLCGDYLNFSDDYSPVGYNNYFKRQ